MRGVPGSGKSTYIQKHWPDAQVFSTDNYWLRPDGTYDFNPRLLQQAHEWNLSDFRWFVSKYPDVFAVVDNCNVLIDHFLPYLQGHQKKWYVCEMPLHTYGSTHNVPAETIERMKAKFEPLADHLDKIPPEILSRRVTSFPST